MAHERNGQHHRVRRRRHLSVLRHPLGDTGAAIKQGWGDDGDDSPNAEFNSTGYVDGGTYAVAILTDGSTHSYGTAISNMVTSEATALMPGGKLDDPAQHNPVIANLATTTTGSTVHISGTATDPDTTAAIIVQVTAGGATVASGTTATANRFSLNFVATNGPHTYTVTAINVGEGTSNAISTAPEVAVDGSPQGTVESVAGGPGKVTISGHEINPNLAAGQDPTVTVTINGTTTVTEPVNDPTAAVPESTSSASTLALTGYTLTVLATAGSDNVSVTYVGTDGAPNTTQGTWRVTVAETATQRRDTELRIAIPILLATLLAGLGLLVMLRRRHRRPDSPSLPFG